MQRLYKYNCLVFVASGNSMGGHYTAFIKNANKKWYHFNDTRVNEIKESSVISNKAYCLFYRKKN